MDTISEMLTKIRNAQAVGRESVTVSYSNLKWEIARILKEKGYLKDYKKERAGAIDKISLFLKYEKIGNNKMQPAISGIRKISKSGKRVYVGKNDIKKVRNGYGIAIISTSRGVMTNEEARRAGVGGEIICEVW